VKLLLSPVRFLLVFSDFDPGLDPNIGSDLRIRLCKCSFYIANLSIVTPFFFFFNSNRKMFVYNKFTLQKIVSRLNPVHCPRAQGKITKNSFLILFLDKAGPCGVGDAPGYAPRRCTTSRIRAGGDGAHAGLGGCPLHGANLPYYTSRLVSLSLRSISYTENVTLQKSSNRIFPYF